jgi:hypothetical protein
MRDAHSLVSLPAVAAMLRSLYPFGMNSTFLIQDRSRSRSASVARHTPGLDDAHAIKKKALERWENEGGKIKELFLRPEGNDSARRKPHPPF